MIHNYYRSDNIGGEDIVFENEYTSLTKKMGKNNVYLYEVKNDNINKLHLLFTIWFSPKHYFKVKRLIKKNGINIVHVHNFFPKMSPSVFFAAKFSGVKVLHTVHNYRFWCISGTFYRDQVGICEICTKNRFSLHGVRHNCYRNSTSQSALAQLAFWFFELIGTLDAIDYLIVLTKFQVETIGRFGRPHSHGIDDVVAIAWYWRVVGKC